LKIVSSGTNVFLSWTIPSLVFTLQEKSDLTTANWTDVTNTPSLNLTNLQYQVILARTAERNFYRLKH